MLKKVAFESGSELRRLGFFNREVVIRCSGVERSLLLVGSGIHRSHQFFFKASLHARSRKIWWPQANEAAQVLNGCHQQKLFSGSAKSPQFQPGEAEMLLHMSKEHFGLFAQAS